MIMPETPLFYFSYRIAPDPPDPTRPDAFSITTDITMARRRSKNDELPQMKVDTLGYLYRIKNPQSGSLAPPTEKKRWRAVLDPKSGAHYIWDVKTNGVSWTPPSALKWKDERTPPPPPPTRVNRIQGGPDAEKELCMWACTENATPAACTFGSRQCCLVKGACPHIHDVYKNRNASWNVYLLQEGRRILARGLNTYEFQHSATLAWMKKHGWRKSWEGVSSASSGLGGPPSLGAPGADGSVTLGGAQAPENWRRPKSGGLKPWRVGRKVTRDPALPTVQEDIDEDERLRRQGALQVQFCVPFGPNWPLELQSLCGVHGITTSFGYTVQGETGREFKLDFHGDIPQLDPTPDPVDFPLNVSKDRHYPCCPLPVLQ